MTWGKILDTSLMSDARYINHRSVNNQLIKVQMVATIKYLLIGLYTIWHTIGECTSYDYYYVCLEFTPPSTIFQSYPGFLARVVSNYIYPTINRSDDEIATRCRARSQTDDPCSQDSISSTDGASRTGLQPLFNIRPIVSNTFQLMHLLLVVLMVEKMHRSFATPTPGEYYIEPCKPQLKSPHCSRPAMQPGKLEGKNAAHFPPLLSPALLRCWRGGGCKWPVQNWRTRWI